MNIQDQSAYWNERYEKYGDRLVSWEGDAPLEAAEDDAINTGLYPPWPLNRERPTRPWHVLDLGCGQGLTRALLTAPVMSWHGIDGCPAAIALAEAQVKAPDTTWECRVLEPRAATVETLPDADVVLCRRFLQNLPPGQGRKEFIRALRARYQAGIVIDMTRAGYGHLSDILSTMGDPRCEILPPAFNAPLEDVEVSILGRPVYFASRYYLLTRAIMKSRSVVLREKAMDLIRQDDSRHAQRAPSMSERGQPDPQVGPALMSWGTCLSTEVGR